MKFCLLVSYVNVFLEMVQLSTKTRFHFGSQVSVLPQF